MQKQQKDIIKTRKKKPSSKFLNICSDSTKQKKKLKNSTNNDNNKKPEKFIATNTSPLTT